MYKIINKVVLAPQVKLFEVYAPLIAEKAKPGQFVILKLDERGERIPITIANIDVDEGTVGIVFREAGKTTKKLGRLNQGDSIQNFVGPLGKPIEIKKYGRVLCIGGGVMIAALYFQALALLKAGNEIVAVIGARDKEQLILKKEMRDISSYFYVATDDGSEGNRNLNFIEDLLVKKKIDFVIALGPLVMMKTVAQITYPYTIPTLVSLNPIMVDGTGLCGACRVTVGGETKFACVDGPHFNGHLVDFDELTARRQMYVPEEKMALIFRERLKDVKNAKA